MPNALSINRVTNANIYIDGTNSLLGQAEEINLPKLSTVQVEHKALGMRGKIELPSGFDKMEMTIKFNSFYQTTFTQFANPYKSLKLQIRASVESWEGGDKTGELPLVIYATVTPKGFPLGNFKSNDNVEFEADVACTQIKMEYNGQQVMEFDAMANIFTIAGVDQLATYRANLGI
jgi:P2 family phage contractile tail tube protein